MKKIINLIVIMGLILITFTGCTNDNYGHFVKTGELITPRAQHIAALLKDGNVLIAGGDDFSNVPHLLNSAEIYLTKEGRFVKTGNMLKKRYGAAAIALSDGRVVVLGGMSPNENNAVKNTTGDGLSSKLIEVYNPKTQKFEEAGYLKHYTYSPNLTLMKDGKVFILGGNDEKAGMSGSAEIYDPKTKTTKLTSKMNYVREGCSVVLLNDGRILISGGEVSPAGRGKYDHTLKPYSYKNKRGVVTKTDGSKTSSDAEIYDPKIDKFTLIGNMNYQRKGHSSMLLHDGQILIVGGSRDWTIGPLLDKKVYDKNIYPPVKRSREYALLQGCIQDIELFNPTTNKFKVVGKLNYAICASQLNLLNNRYILASGSLGKTEEIIDIKDFKTYPTKPMIQKIGGTATNIAKNKVLIVGGFFLVPKKTNTAEIFELDIK